MATVNVDLSCTATGNAVTTSQPTKVLSATGTGSSVLTRLPQRFLNITITTVPKLLNRPGRLLSVTATHSVVISLVRLGADTYDVVEATAKWAATEFGKWSVSFAERFSVLVRGRPGG